MGWQDIYKKKMQAAGLENDIRSTDDVQVFYRKEPEQYGDWRDSFMKKMEDSGLSGDIRLGQTQTAARQTVTAPATTTTAAKKRDGRNPKRNWQTKRPSRRRISRSTGGWQGLIWTITAQRWNRLEKRHRRARSLIIFTLLALTIPKSRRQSVLTPR